MAKYSAGVNADQAVKVWAAGLDAVALKKTAVFQAQQSGIVDMRDELSKGPGDRVRMSLRALASGTGRTANQTLEGNEEGMTLYYDDLFIEQLRHAVRVPHENADTQRVPFSVRQEAKLTLADWFRDRYDTIFFNQLTGATPVNSYTNPAAYNGHNTIVAVDSNHVVNVDTETAPESFDTADDFNVTALDKAVEKAKTLDIPIRPIRTNGGEYYVCYLHPYQVTSLRTDASNTRWWDMMVASLQGGRVDDNPIFTGALGIYNGVVIKENSRVPKCVNSGDATAFVDDTRAAVFCGAQALACAYGRKSSRFNRHSWKEESFDYENEIGIASGVVFGMKRTVYNSETYGSILIPTYAVAS